MGLDPFDPETEIKSAPKALPPFIGKPANLDSMKRDDAPDDDETEEDVPEEPGNE
jgi:hypothetical protein